MPEINHIDANSGDVLLMVGTMKGAFLVRSSAGREDWSNEPSRERANMRQRHVAHIRSMIEANKLMIAGATILPSVSGG